MTRLNRVLRMTLAVVLLLPLIGSATPIIAPPSCWCAGVSGWVNGDGNFAVDPRTSLVTGTDASYSVATSLFSARSSMISFNGGGTHFAFTPGEMRLDAIVQPNGTVTGNLLGGILTVRAGVDGVPEAGILPGETLLVGHAIDSANLVDDPFDVLFLFHLTFTHSALSSLGDYATYEGPFAGSHGNSPWDWGSDWHNLGGFTFTDFYATRRVAEPGTIALLGLSLAGLAAARRRKQ